MALSALTAPSVMVSGSWNESVDVREAWLRSVELDVSTVDDWVAAVLEAWSVGVLRVGDLVEVRWQLDWSWSLNLRQRSGLV